VRGIGMRWWLALAFALIAGVTALAVALVFSQRTERALAERADVLAVGNTVAAAESVRRAIVAGSLDTEISQIMFERKLALFVFDEEGRLLTPQPARGTTLESVPDEAEALETALRGERYVATLPDSIATVVALPVYGTEDAAAVLAYVPQPQYAASNSILYREIVVAALVAFPIGALAGLLVALLIARRLRRIAVAAAEIEAGRFDSPLQPRFRDELGSLAATIDRMRERLRVTFDTLEVERDRLGRLLDRLHDGVVLVGRDIEVEFANGAARHALGAPLAEGDQLPDRWSDLSLRDLAAALFRPGARVVHARAVLEDGRTFAVAGIPPAPAGDSAIFVLTDVSEQERREQAEREFVANAAHELKTPLTAILGAVDVLQSGAKEIPEARDRFLGHVEREAGRLSRLSRALLILARAQTGQEAPGLVAVAVAPILETVAAGITASPDVVVAVDCPPDLEVFTEPDLLEQIVANLGANAAKHTESGRVDFLAFGSEDGTVTVEVADTGPGIEPSERERIFDRFYRGGDRGAEGFGLGLAIVRHAVRAIGGSVDVDSELGRGTRVRVVLPAVERDASAAAVTPASVAAR
jgi:two-component system phosphate regulon sensor histidine kinase PhoR